METAKCQETIIKRYFHDIFLIKYHLLNFKDKQ